MDEIKENICQGGKMNGYEFTLNLHAASTRISCPYGGYYQKSAIKNEIERSMTTHPHRTAKAASRFQRRREHRDAVKHSRLCGWVRRLVRLLIFNQIQTDETIRSKPRHREA